MVLGLLPCVVSALVVVETGIQLADLSVVERREHAEVVLIQGFDFLFFVSFQVLFAQV